MPTTPRMSLRYPSGTDVVNIDLDLSELAADIDATAVMFGQGTLSARPTSTPGSPGKQGRMYYATDTGHVYWDHGTGWVDVGPAALGTDSITAVHLAPDSVGSSEIQGGSVGTGEIAANAINADKVVDGQIGYVKLGAEVKPSQGAGGGSEALRAIGGGSMNVVAGNDSRLSEGAAGVATVRSLGVGATQAAAGNDTRLSDSRDPINHGGDHAIDGGDPIIGIKRVSMGLSVTVPTAGNYWVQIGASGVELFPSNNVRLTLTAGGITLDARAGAGGGGTQGVHASPSDQGRMVGLGAAQVLTMTDAGSVAATKPYICIERVP